jgi:hypothetical protein
MDQPFHITVFDSFHRHEPEEAWVSGTFATAEETIAAVKRKIDNELAYLWSEVCHQDKGISTLDRLISHYNSFAEVPVAFDRDGKMIFDSTAYMESRAAEMIDEAPAPYGLQGRAGPQPSASRHATQGAAAAKHRFPRSATVWAFLNRPRPPTVLLGAFLAFCLLFALIYRALR